MALSGAASATACPYKPEKHHRLRHALQIMGATFLGDKKTGDLALHLRCHDYAAGFCQCLHQRRGVRRVPVNLSRGIHHDRAGFDAHARVEPGCLLDDAIVWPWWCPSHIAKSIDFSMAVRKSI
jgi:hypothetical protein